MNTAYVAQPEDLQRLEWLNGGTLTLLLDRATTGGGLTVGRFELSQRAGVVRRRRD